jgi:hypothetical protein
MGEQNIPEILRAHGGEDFDCSLLSCDAVWTHRPIISVPKGHIAFVSGKRDLKVTI